MAVRWVLTVLALVIYSVVNFTRNEVSTLIVGNSAGGQLLNSDSAYISSMAGMHLGQYWGISLFVLLAVWLAIWWSTLFGKKA